MFVDPMIIGVIPSYIRDGLLLGPLLSAAQPIREDFTETLFRLGCGGDLSGLYAFPSSTAITVLDLAVGSVSGAGSLNLELGGVQATTAELGAFEGLGDLPAAAGDPRAAPGDPGRSAPTARLRRRLAAGGRHPRGDAPTPPPPAHPSRRSRASAAAPSSASVPVGSCCCWPVPRATDGRCVGPSARSPWRRSR